jgi:hypothetical protein
MLLSRLRRRSHYVLFFFVKLKLPGICVDLFFKRFKSQFKDITGILAR